MSDLYCTEGLEFRLFCDDAVEQNLIFKIDATVECDVLNFAALNTRPMKMIVVNLTDRALRCSLGLHRLDRYVLTNLFQYSFRVEGPVWLSLRENLVGFYNDVLCNGAGCERTRPH